MRRWLTPGLIGTVIGALGLGAAAVYVVGVVTSPPRPAATAPRANDARQAYARADYESALRLWTRAAEAGDGAAQMGLGDMYRLGRGVPQNLGQAVQWYGKAAGQNLPEAQYQLGLLVTEGGGGARLNTDEGLYWIKNAALRGVLEAQFHVAKAHETGQRGAPRVDPVEATAWYGLAAGNGHPEAAAAAERLRATLTAQQTTFAGQRERELREAQVRP